MIYLIILQSSINTGDLITRIIVGLFVAIVVWVIKQRHDDRKIFEKRLSHAETQGKLQKQEFDDYAKYKQEKENQNGRILEEIKKSLGTLVTDMTQVKIDIATMKNK